MSGVVGDLSTEQEAALEQVKNMLLFVFVVVCVNACLQRTFSKL